MEFQNRVQTFCEKNDMLVSTENRMLDLVSEVGEVAKEILKMNSYGKQGLEYREEFKEELGDLFFALIALANTMNINLEDALNIVLAKYEKRLEKGSAASGN